MSLKKVYNYGNYYVYLMIAVAMAVVMCILVHQRTSKQCDCNLMYARWETITDTRGKWENDKLNGEQKVIEIITKRTANVSRSTHTQKETDDRRRAINMLWC